MYVLIVMQLQDRLFLKIGEKRENFFDGGGNHRINIQLQFTPNVEEEENLSSLEERDNRSDKQRAESHFDVCLPHRS